MAILTAELGHLTGDGPGFITDADLTAKRSADLPRFLAFRKTLSQRGFPICGPLFDDADFARIEETARDLRGTFDNLLLVGIGGSTLGFRAILQFLKGPYSNLFPAQGAPRVFTVDNIDPVVTEELARELDFRRTLIVYISKSGSTPESAANFLVFFDKLKRAGGDPRLCVFICDQADNGINRIAAELQCRLLHIPADLGGRFSVLSAVGLLPTLLCGLDARGLVEGARALHNHLSRAEPDGNALYIVASALHAYFSSTKNIHFLFAYSSLLWDFNLWFSQLWSESLGKRLDLSGNLVHRGATPVPAVGATDQHSVLQLLREGPRDRVVGFLRIGDHGRDIEIPPAFEAHEEYAYLGGHTVGEQLEIERRCTEIAVHESGNPCYTLALGRRDARSLGALFYFWELAIISYAALDEVNPFGQPGVEFGKQMTYALMGRGKFAPERERHEATLSRYREGSQTFPMGD